MEERLIGKLSTVGSLKAELSIGKIVVFINTMSDEIIRLENELAAARARINELELELGGKNAN